MTYRYSSCESDMSDMGVDYMGVDYSDAPDWSSEFRPGMNVSKRETNCEEELAITKREQENLKSIERDIYYEEDDYEEKLLEDFLKKKILDYMNNLIIREDLGLLPNGKSTPSSLKDLCTVQLRRDLVGAFLVGRITVEDIRLAFFQLERWGKIQVLGRWTHKLTYLVYSLCRYLPASLVAPIHFDRELRDKPYLVTRFRRNMDEHLSNLPKYKEYSRVYIRCKTCNKLFDCSDSLPYRELPFCVDCLDSDGWYNPLLDKFADTC